MRSVSSQQRLDETRHLREIEGLSICEIARIQGITRQAVSLRIIKHGLVRAPRPKPSIAAETLHQLYYVDGMTLKSIASMLGVSVPFVRSEMRRHNIEATPRRLRGKYRREHLYQLYMVEKRSQKSIAKEFRMGILDLRRALKHWGFPIRWYEPPSLPLNKQMVHDLYMDETRSIKEICDILHCSSTTLYAHLARNGITERRMRRR